MRIITAAIVLLGVCQCVLGYDGDFHSNIPQKPNPVLEGKIANLSQDVEELSYRLGQVHLANEALREELAQLKRNLMMTQNAQKSIIAKLKRMDANWKEASSAQKKDIVTQVTRQIQKLAAQTEVAIQGLSKQISGQSYGGGYSSNSYSKEGFEYTVQPGDTLSTIAETYNSSIPDVQHANQISNPKGLCSGEKIFIPQQ